MNPTRLYRYLGLGRTPKRYKDQLQAEGILFLGEGISGVVTFKDFQTLERRYSWKRSLFIGSVVVTVKTLAVFALIRPVFLLPLGNGQQSKLHCELVDGNHLSIGFDATAFSEQWSGEVECRIRTTQAGKLFEVLSESPR